MNPGLPRFYELQPLGFGKRGGILQHHPVGERENLGKPRTLAARVPWRQGVGNSSRRRRPGGCDQFPGNLSGGGMGVSPVIGAADFSAHLAEACGFDGRDARPTRENGHTLRACAGHACDTLTDGLLSCRSSGFVLIGALDRCRTADWSTGRCLIQPAA